MRSLPFTDLSLPFTDLSFRGLCEVPPHKCLVRAPTTRNPLLIGAPRCCCSWLPYIIKAATDGESGNSSALRLLRVRSLSAADLGFSKPKHKCLGFLDQS